MAAYRYYHEKHYRIDYMVCADFIRHNGFWRPSVLIFRSGVQEYVMKPHPQSFRHFNVNDYYDNLVLPDQPWFQSLEEYYSPNLHVVDETKFDWYLYYILYERYLKKTPLDMPNFGTTDRAVYHYLLVILPRGCLYFLNPRELRVLADPAPVNQASTGQRVESESSNAVTSSSQSEDSEPEHAE